MYSTTFLGFRQTEPTTLFRAYAAQVVSVGQSWVGHVSAVAVVGGPARAVRARLLHAVDHRLKPVAALLKLSQPGISIGLISYWTFHRGEKFYKFCANQ